MDLSNLIGEQHDNFVLNGFDLDDSNKLIIKYSVNGKESSKEVDLSGLTSNNFELIDGSLDGNQLKINYKVNGEIKNINIDLSSLVNKEGATKDIATLHENSIISSIDIYNTTGTNRIKLTSIYDHEHVIYVELTKYEKIYRSIYCDNLYNDDKSQNESQLTFKLEGSEINGETTYDIKSYGHYKIEDIEFVIYKNGIQLLKKSIFITFDDVELIR